MTQADNDNTVKTGMVVGVFVTLVSFLVLYLLFPQYDAEVILVERFQLAIQCLVFPAAFFVITVVRIGMQRFGNSSDDPTKTVANSQAMAIDLRVLSNTHEQIVLFALNTLCLAMLLPFAFLSLLPVYSAVFVIGRVLFWAGYRYNVLWRAPGFAMNIIPAAAGLGYCCIVLVLRFIQSF